jgi:protein-tyrosine phosphatase
MPGRYEDLDMLTDELIKKEIHTIICLTDKEEIKEKSPQYLNAIETGKLQNINIIYNPVSDYQIPTDKQSLEKYESTLHKAFHLLRSENILIHCAGGVGRTGTFTVIFLRMLGFPYEEALKITKDSGSGPENPEQQNFSRDYKILLRVLKEKKCMNCDHGATYPGYRYECGLRIDGKYVHEDGYCPEELICEHWIIDDYDGMTDMSVSWGFAKTIEVD